MNVVVCRYCQAKALPRPPIHTPDWCQTPSRLTTAASLQLLGLQLGKVQKKDKKIFKMSKPNDRILKIVSIIFTNVVIRPVS